MQLVNEFTVPLPADQVWPALLDVERMARCVPGASVTSIDDDSFTGTVRVKVGPVSFQYAGQATFVEVHAEDRLLVLEGSGRERGGNGSVRAAVALRVEAADAGTSRARLTTDLDITGKAAQFGRAVIGQVIARLVDDFAARLAHELTGEAGGAVGGPPSVLDGAETDGLTRSPTSAPPAPTAFDPVRSIAVPVLRDHAAEILAAVAVVVSFAALRHARRPVTRRGAWPSAYYC